MSTPAKAYSHKRYNKISFNWAEQYALQTVSTYAASGTVLYGWVLNRPGCNTTVFPEVSKSTLTENPAAVGNFGASHQPYLWNEVIADFDEYRIYGCKYVLHIQNCTTDSGARLDDQINVAVGVTQERFSSTGPATEYDMSADHDDNQAIYMEGRHKEWRRRTLQAGETMTLKGYVNFKKLLKPSKHNNRNDALESYPWFRADETPSETAVIGDDAQNQPYYGWTPAKCANIEENSGDAAWVDATYARAPQCGFLYLWASSEKAQTEPGLRISLSVTQYIEFKRGDPQYSQS